ncbi:hypothetical protein QQS21_010343 [Conoideocrella luteorostrata]|uniref:Uncharacterized protein n=1 Tax=Conoideocrella luteorostrata TaxID=1105319 RepID=A0AAJ0FPG9_9HYPO|nr:hypothetical protein QQS21_010343 [Conoideocrella luteorostrata]
MVLQFINQTATEIGKSERRIIRSHVMMGKNAGRPRRSTKKQFHTKSHLKPSLVPASGCLMPSKLLWNDLCLTSFPQKLDSESTKLMHRCTIQSSRSAMRFILLNLSELLGFFDISDVLFPPQFCSKFDIVKSIWVNCVLADEAYFHSTLAISASYVNFFERKPGISCKTLHHISKAYELVNLKLSGPDSVSHSAIAAVASLAIYQQIHHQHSTGLVHLNGLYRMIQLQGGISSLMKNNRALALKPLRLDVEFAMRSGSPTLFHSHIALTSPVLRNFRAGKARSNGIPFKNLPPIMLDVIDFSSLLNDKGREGQVKLSPLDYLESLLSLQYRLLAEAPLSQQPLDLSGDFYCHVAYLAMMAFMTTLLPEYRRDDSAYSLLASRLETAIHYFDIRLAGSSDSDFSLVLWVLFIGGISVLKYKDRQRVSHLIVATSKRLNLVGWSEICLRLCEFPWIHGLHGDLGRRLWEDAQHGSSNKYLATRSHEELSSGDFKYMNLEYPPS